MTLSTPRLLPARLTRRARARTADRPALPAGYARPERTWRPGHYDGPTGDGRLKWARFLATGIVAPIYRNNPGACLSLILKAQSLDVPLATATENLHWNPALGKGSISAQLMAGLLHRHGFTFKVTEETDQQVIMTFYQDAGGRRKRLGTTSWTIIEAVGAGLTRRDLWRHYPTDMLWARCLMRGARRYAHQVGTGLAYTREELDDMSAPAEGSEVADAVQDILDKATTTGTTAGQIRNDLVKQARVKRLLDADCGDGTTLGYVLGMLWGEARARETDQAAAAAPVAVEPADPPAGTAPLSCGCPATTLRTGRHDPEVHHA